MNLVSQSSFDLHNNRVTPYDWRFMKYEWIETEAYSNGKNLVEYVKKVLKEFGLLHSFGETKNWRSLIEEILAC